MQLSLKLVDLKKLYWCIPDTGGFDNSEVPFVTPSMTEEQLHRARVHATQTFKAAFKSFGTEPVIKIDILGKGDIGMDSYMLMWDNSDVYGHRAFPRKSATSHGRNISSPSNSLSLRESKGTSTI